jgi:hypothetical protein
LESWLHRDGGGKLRIFAIMMHFKLIRIGSVSRKHLELLGMGAAIKLVGID